MVEHAGWYCGHCKRGVPSVEVTFNEEHTVCGRVITNDYPPNEDDPRIASLTEAVRVLTDEMEAIKRLSDTSPTRTLGEASDNLMHVNDHARAALTTAKELTNG